MPNVVAWIARRGMVRLKIAAVAGVLFACVTAELRAEPSASNDIIMVEEDWQLVVRDPSPENQGPQATCIISPTGNLDATYCAFDLNHQSLPSFRGGGMQLQIWNGERSDDAKNPPTNDALWHEHETVTWTQRMALLADVLAFEIVEGHSQTWGDFGGDELLITQSTTLANLNAYDPQVSATNSGVGFASNRVRTLELKKVRYYTINGLLREDSTPRILVDHSNGEEFTN